MPDYWHMANTVFADPVAAVGALPSATVGEVFAVRLRVFAVCLGHMANSWSPVVSACVIRCTYIQHITYSALRNLPVAALLARKEKKKERKKEEHAGR